MFSEEAKYGNSDQSHKSIAISEDSERLFKLLFDDLSVRAQNILRYNNLNSLEDLTPWIEGACNDFLKLRNCGKQTSIELMVMIRELRESIEIIHQTTDERDCRTIVTTSSSSSEPSNTISLSEERKRRFMFLFDNLSIRAQHILKDNHIDSIEGLSPWIKGETDSFLWFKNCGKRTSLELMEMVFELRDFIDFYQSGKEDGMEGQEKDGKQLVENLMAINKSLPPLPVYYRVALKYTQLGYFPFFLALYLCLLLDDNKDFNMMIQCSNIYANESTKTLSEISLKNKITRERVRQIRLKQFRKFHDRVVKISKAEAFEASKYNASSEYELRNIASREEVPFNSNFIVWVICLIDNHYKLIGEPSKAFFSSSYSAETLYAVPKVLSDFFDFKEFIESVKTQINEKRFYEERVELEQYVGHLCKENCDAITFFEIVKECRNIMERGYPELISNSQIIFPANSRKAIPYLVEDLLREFDRPMNVDEILEQLSNRFPNLKPTASQIRGAIRNKSIVAINRTRSYALSEWNQSNMRSRTIRDLAAEYLNSLTPPVATLSEICAYIAKFRDAVKKNSVKANLLAEANNLFCLYYKDDKQFIGLTDGHIDDKYIKQDKLQERRAFFDSIERLESFIKKNDRFPYSSSVDEEESRLFRFYNNSLGYLRKDVLSVEEAAEIERIASTYGHLMIKKERVSWDEWLERFVKHITENNSLPHRSSPEYAWYDENKDLFEAGLLTPEQTSSFAFLKKIVARIS
ncbi:MAG: hypothetical protein IKM99_05255 [Bacteroidales bacterium]|nr:hypothetical protein [Bacteroidales bacterium]